MSFSSNNISGSSMMDGSSIVQQSSHQGQIQKQGSSTATSQPTSQETVNMLQLHKKTRLDVRQKDIFQQQAIQQLLQRQDSLQLQGQINPKLQTLIQQQRMLQQRQQQQQQILQSLPPMQRAHMQQQQQQLQQQMMQSPHLRHPFDSGICARRLMQYLYHQRHRPPENTIFYWRKFVSEYFAPRAKKRWCLSLYDNVGNHTLGVFPQAVMDAWHCEICGSKSGKGFGSECGCPVWAVSVSILPVEHGCSMERVCGSTSLCLSNGKRMRSPTPAAEAETIRKRPCQAKHLTGKDAFSRLEMEETSAYDVRRG